ncbi:hypothetical protein J6590_034937 [Homalodisca vitripennis]|nr:hypothetical protein J6590_034937 [Homalodisca vitripennis]
MVVSCLQVHLQNVKNDRMFSQRQCKGLGTATAMCKKPKTSYPLHLVQIVSPCVYLLNPLCAATGHAVPDV